MTSRNPHIVEAWQNVDVIEGMIKDVTFVGKQKLLLKENDPTNLTAKIKKTKMSRKSMAASALANEEIDGCTILSSETGMLNMEVGSTLTRRELSKQAHANLCNHFSIVGHNAASVSDPTANKTSNNRLNSRIGYSDMIETLKTYKYPYQNSVSKMNDHYEELFFQEWYNLMRFGFNVLLFGVGSKRTLMQNFCNAHLDNHFYMELIGYHHDFNFKNVYKRILVDILEREETFKTADDQLNAINLFLDRDLFLIIHNIDGECMRDSSIQYGLCALAANPFIHIMASTDHINTCQLWDQSQYVSLKWVHYDVHTLLPYNEEIKFESSLMLNHTNTVQLSSLIQVLRSLTKNAKGIFVIMVERVLEPNNLKKCITFQTLYKEARERFLVSNELTMRAQLTEFIDHKLIQLKNERDGGETIYIQIDDANLKHYIEELKDKI